MDTSKRVRSSALVFVVAFAVLFSVAFTEELSLVIGESNSTLQISPGLHVEGSPGLKPGTRVSCERVDIHGLSRLKNLRKFAHSVKVKVSQVTSSLRRPNVEVCFHRNASLGIGMCSHGRWDKVSKGSWVHSMSPFDHKLLDIRVIGSSTETFEVSIEEEFFLYRIIFLISGTILLSSASFLSQSLTFYYSSAMAVGIILVILMVLFQGMKLLPTGRKSSLAIFIYSCIVGMGSFLLSYVPGLLHSTLEALGVSEDMYNPLAIFLLAFIVLAGAWLGFWVVRKLVLTEDGSIDTSTSYFVSWCIRILAIILILQSSVDPLLAAEALISGIMMPSVLRRITGLRYLRRICKKLFKFFKNIWRNSESLDLSPLQDSYYEHMYKRPEDFKFSKYSSKHFTLNSYNSPIEGTTRKSPSKLSDVDAYPSTFHNTPRRRKFSKEEWDNFTRDSTKKAVEDLVSSPDFGKWVASNADRITVTPRKSSGSPSVQRRQWLHWF